MYEFIRSFVFSENVYVEDIKAWYGLTSRFVIRYYVADTILEISKGTQNYRLIQRSDLKIE